MKPYIQTIITIVVGAKTIFGKFFSKKFNMESNYIMKIKKWGA